MHSAHEFYSFEKQPLFDVLVTSYEMVQLDATILRKFNWSSIVIKYLEELFLFTLLFWKSVSLLIYSLQLSVDEAHKIKNLYCKLFSCFKHYTSEFRLLLTVSFILCQTFLYR
jgi:SNF2 family DNA or RNA helicase